MLPTRLAFVDIETTGPRVTHDRIIEIGIIRVEEGRVTETFKSLINPKTHVPSFIEHYTGISSTELEQAPDFTSLAATIIKLLEDCTFVAHNVRFDYGFLKNEFQRLGYTFSTPHFCTAALSRRLFPEHPRHNLDVLIQRYGFTCPSRHRAYDDAHVLWQFYDMLTHAVAPEALAAAVKQGTRRPSLPDHLKEQGSTLPTTPGVYIFYDEKNYPLYVGKSVNIRERVLSHFTSDYTSSREMNICQQTASIEALPTAGELGALLKESELVKSLQPLYNRKLRYVRTMHVLKRTQTPEGYSTATLETCTQLTPEDAESLLGTFKSKKQAKEFLLDQAKQHKLCHKLLQLETGKGSCFGYQLGTCQGACLTKEAVDLYNLRATLAFSARSIRRWPFSGPITIREQDAHGRNELFLVDKWCLLGRYQSEDFELTTPEYVFDVDTYRILERFILANENQYAIRPYGKRMSS